MIIEQADRRRNLSLLAENIDPLTVFIRGLERKVRILPLVK